MPTVLFTGFPGFLGVQLLPRVLRRDPGLRAVCLVQAHWLETARRTLSRLESEHQDVAGRTDLVVGDITVPGLGLDADQRAALERDATELFHLAAVYDLSVGEAVGQRVNVDGTRNVVELAAGLSALQRLQYVSTCYVSGRYPGIFRETDLEIGQTFNNFYESTKYEAEVLVRDAIRGGLPASIYRPAVVVGDSTTGETQKYDGPYYALQLFLRQRGVAVVPLIGDSSAFRFNVVPRDFVVDAIAALSGAEEALGRTFNLADPNPLTIDEMMALFARVTGRRMVPMPLPRGLAKTAIDRIPGVKPVLRVPASTLDYLTHPTHYDTALTTPVLAKLGIECPPLPSYVENLVRYMREHPEISSAAMV